MKAIVYGQSLARSEDVDYEVETLIIEVELPFIPSKGTGLALTPEGEIYTVDEVMWEIKQPDRVIVFLEEEENLARIRPYAEMREQGWRMANEEEEA